MAQIEGNAAPGHQGRSFNDSRTYATPFKSGDPKAADKNLITAASKLTDELVQAATGERVDLSKPQYHYFPDSIRDGSNQGYPFMQFRIKQTKGEGFVNIYLPFPPGVVVSDGANYGNFDMGTLSGGLDFAKQLAQGNNTSTNQDALALALISKEKLSGRSSGLNIRSKGALKAGVATNPYTRQAFENVNIRTFNFTFKLVAESENESKMARRIERSFRKFLYPKRAGAVALTYPPLVDIKFWAEGRENDYMPKIKPCYLTSLESTFNESTNNVHTSSAAPLEVSLSLSFQEERSLIRQDLYENDDTTIERDGFHNDPVPSGE